MQLSKQQETAVHYLGSPALVVAGAGSGKTRTLTAKIAHLLDQGFDPARILAITFTNKAAGEMKTRLVRMTGLAASRFPWVRTYHSACYAILKAHKELLGFSRSLQVLSSYHQEKTLKEITLRLNYDKKNVPMFMAQISKAKNSGDPKRYFATAHKMVRSRLLRVYGEYEKALMAQNAVDFDNILFLARNLLRDHEDIRNHYRQAFAFILIDEYQDSNDLQEELTGLLLGEHNNLFCVGDDWQSVYGFRGSNVNHFLSFQDKYPDARLFKLERNYRSADEIVQVANRLIDNNPGRMEKNCFSHKTGGMVTIKRFYDEFLESEWVARKVRILFDMGINYDEMAVIYRTKALSLWFEKAFRKLNIPYRMMGSKGFFDRKEILDINCYLSAAFYPMDDVAFERIINTPRRGIGPGMLAKIQKVKTGGMGLQDAARKVLAERILSPKVHQALSDLFVLLDAIRDMRPDHAMETIFQEADYLGYLEGMAKTKEEYESRQDNLKELVYLASMKESMEDYLEETTLVQEDREEEDERNRYGVKLSTAHASKGLEFLTVFVVGCEEMTFPHWRCMDTAAELEEERRLMYVAVTRAEKNLYLTSASSRRRRPTMQSRFLDEIEEHLDEEFAA